MRSTTGMATRRRWLIMGTCLMLGALVHGPAEASRSRRARVFLDGYVGAAPAGTTTTATITLQVGGERKEFAVTGTGVTKGKRSPQQILDDLRTKQNVLVLTGSSATLGALGTIPAGQLVRIAGDHRRGSNQLSVTSIGAPPAGATAAPPAPATAAPPAAKDEK